MPIPKTVTCPHCGSHKYTFKVTGSKRPIQRLGDDAQNWAIATCLDNPQCRKQFLYNDDLRDTSTRIP